MAENNARGNRRSRTTDGGWIFTWHCSLLTDASKKGGRKKFERSETSTSTWEQLARKKRATECQWRNARPKLRVAFCARWPSWRSTAILAKKSQAVRADATPPLKSTMSVACGVNEPIRNIISQRDCKARTPKRPIDVDAPKETVVTMQSVPSNQ